MTDTAIAQIKAEAIEFVKNCTTGDEDLLMMAILIAEGAVNLTFDYLEQNGYKIVRQDDQ